MRNLRNIRYSAWRAPSEVTAICWDAGRDEAVATFGPSKEHGKIELVRVVDQRSSSSSRLQCQAVASWDAPSPSPDLAVDRVLGLHHFTDSMTTCLVLAGGDIVIVQEDEGASTAATDPRIEIVGSVDAGIAAARWSPDEELLAIATCDHTLVLMSRGFDPVAEAPMTVEDLKASKHVSVGWGKKETQFQGKGARARALRDPTIPEKVDEGAPSAVDDGRTTISWRGDGAYVAVNSPARRGEPGTRRAVRVYSRDGALDSVSEPVDGLEGALSWRPSGNLVAGVQRFTDGRVDVVFFERNGLRHGQFALRVPRDADAATEQISLEWNLDSTVLAVALKDRIQLWTTGNYHWYLKQDILTGPQRAYFAWHSEKPLRFAASVQNKMIWAEYSFITSRGSLTPPHDHGAVAVIDGQTVKLTPFRTANIPPPMAMFELEADSAVTDVAFAQDNSALIVLHQFGVDYYSWKTKGNRSIEPELRDKVEFPARGSDLFGVSALQATLSGRSTIMVLQHGEDPSILTCNLDKGKSWASADASSFSIIQSYSNDTGMRAFAQDPFGKLFDISESGLEGEASPPLLPINVPTLLPWVHISQHKDELLAFGLSRGGQLYANARQLVRNCTSFLVTPNHLVFTTNNHLLKFVHLSSVQDLEVPPDDPENDERCRNIERGARLVAAVPTNMNLVLQMPRGNLETIAPRAMVVAGIRKLIDEGDYGKAFAFCRTQRVDMNILYDHRAEQFHRSVGLFLDQIKDVANIDLFLSGLREEDVSQTMYKDTKPSKDNPQRPPLASTTASASPQSSGGPLSKVNSICDSVLDALRSRKSPSLQNIITAHVCKNPPALDDGLLVVAEMMREDESRAERAVEHICFLVDVNRLYDHALGLYDLSLALLVAQQSQRDPREYVPFIQDLHRLQPPLRQRFAIDDHLGRRDKALGHLQALGAFDEVCTYVAHHGLYQAAIRLYRHDEPRLRALTALYAAHLEAISRFREAGLAYESVGDFTKATATYRAAGAASWRECLAAAQLQSPPPPATTLADLASDLAEALCEARDYGAAASIYLDHLDSPESAVRCLCRAYRFADALRLAAFHRGGGGKDNEAVSSLPLGAVVDAGLADALSSSTEFLADCKAQLAAQVPRILELRRRAVEDPLAFYEGERRPGHDAEQDVPDDVSVAASSVNSRVSTSASLFTRYTGKGGSGSTGTAGSGVSRATSKNRRREEKKRARGRKGTAYEEEYLVNSVRRLVERVEGARDEVERLAFGLARRGMAERARAVEALAVDVVDRCRAAIREVWPPALPAADIAAGTAGTVTGNGQVAAESASAVASGVDYRPTGADAVLHDSLTSRSIRQEPPVIGSLERLSILG